MAESSPVAEVTQNGERRESTSSSSEPGGLCLDIGALVLGLIPALLGGAFFSKMIDEVLVHIQDVPVKHEDNDFGTALLTILSSLKDFLIAFVSTHIGLGLGYGAYCFLLLIKEKDTKAKAGAASATLLGVTACGATVGAIYKWMLYFCIVSGVLIVICVGIFLFLYKRKCEKILKYVLLLIFTVLWYVGTAPATVFAPVKRPCVAVLSAQLLEVAYGHLVYIEAGAKDGGGAGKVCAGAVTAGGAVLLAIQKASPIFSTRAKLGGLLGVSAAAGVALSAAGALSLRYGKESKCKFGGICGSTVAIVGAAAGAFLTSGTQDTRLEIFKAVCAGLVPGMILAESIFKYVWQHVLVLVGGLCGLIPGAN